jgi:hypothetical protein
LPRQKRFHVAGKIFELFLGGDVAIAGPRASLGRTGNARPKEAKMSVQSTKQDIALARLMTAAILLAVVTGSCAPRFIQKTKLALTPAQVAAVDVAAR